MAAHGSPATEVDVVTAALKEIAARRGVTRPRFSIEQGSGAGDGYVGDMIRASIEDEDDVQPRLSVVCKTSALGVGEIVRQIFAAEASIYQVVMPAIEEATTMSAPLPWPRCLLAVVGGPQDCVVLEDLKEQGFVTRDRKEPLDAASAHLVLKQLGKLHGGSMALEVTRPDEFRAMKDAVPNPYAAPAFRHTMMPIVEACLETPEIVSQRFPNGSVVSHELRRLFDRFAEDYVQAMIIDPDGGNSILHGDCHVNNSMWRFDK
ncbi:EcKinase 9, partial [Frankliniella occidentalis]